MDFTTSYTWNGFADKDKDGINPGDEFAADLAIAYQFSVANRSAMSLTPVVEFSYADVQEDSNEGTNVANTGELVLYVSPGIKWTISSMIIEGLVRVPVSQSQKGNQLERDITLLLGFRHMF